jgi:hypothetical protein
MGAYLGICDILNDPESGAIPDQTWFQDLADLSPAPHHFGLVRLSLSVDSNDHVNISSVRASLQAYKAAGYRVGLVLHGGLEVHYQSLEGDEYLAAMPNAKLGLNGDMLLNDYINKFSLTVVGTLTALGDDCPDTVWVWNEGGNDGPELVSGVKPSKPTSIAADNFGAMLSTTTKRIKASCPLVTNILIGSLSCLEKFDTDPSGPFVAGYLHEALTYMGKYGTAAPYDFNSISLNIEGFVPEKYAAWCAQAVSKVIHNFSLTGQAIISECGIQLSTLGTQDWEPTFVSLTTHFGWVIFFAHNTIDPGKLTGYSTTTWGINGQGKIVPHSHTDWFDILAGILARYNNAQSIVVEPPVKPGN